MSLKWGALFNLKKIKFYIRICYHTFLKFIFFRSDTLYAEVLKNSVIGRHAEYVEYIDHSADSLLNKIKPIAFYLPQYHPIPENDLWWGRGFTEWTNVSRAVPQFLGHYQPHLPGELGFYDLRDVRVQHRQIELAKNYGIHGFCYYYYWFNGKRLLHMPVDRLLENRDLDFPYCLCWANENWTRTWDGQDNEILIQQQHSPEDDIHFIESLLPHLEDDRYIRVDGKPLLLVYRPLLLPDPKATVERWREYCHNAGIGDIFLANVQSGDSLDPRTVGFDAAVEFPPGQAIIKQTTWKAKMINTHHGGKVFDYNDLRDFFLNRSIPDYMRFRGVAPGWDNDARKPGNSRNFVDSTPQNYGIWLNQTCKKILRENQNKDKLLFVNAWNEWAEGAHLEPDRRYGYALLEATRQALLDSHK